MVGGGLLLGLVLLGIADALITRNFIMLPETDAEEVIPIVEQPGVAPAQPESDTGGVRKLSGPNIEETLASLSLASTATAQMSIIPRVIPETTPNVWCSSASASGCMNSILRKAKTTICSLSLRHSQTERFSFIIYYHGEKK